jgi:hypothetical protein
MKKLDKLYWLEGPNKKYNKLDCFYDYENNIMKNLFTDNNVGFEYRIIEIWRDEGVI